MGCCECHDHKFDPLPDASDFYSFAAFFADIKEVAVGPQEQVMLPEPSEADKLARARQSDRGRAPARSTRRRPSSKRRRPSGRSRSAEPGGRLEAARADRRGGRQRAPRSRFAKDGVDCWWAATARRRDIYTVVVPVNLPTLTALRLEVLPHNSLPGKGPGRADNGNFVLSEIRATIAPRANPAAAVPLTLRRRLGRFRARRVRRVAAAIDGNRADRLGHRAANWPAEHVAVFEVQGAPLRPAKRS